ncbi:MAG: two-component system, NarL family, invasion response regulator UvrY [Actinomycetota bacterium]
MTRPEGGNDPVVRVLVVDDQAPFRQAAKAVVSVTPGFEVVAEAASGEDAVTMAHLLAPDLVLMDVHLPGIDGLAACRAIVADHPATTVLLLSTYQEEDVPGDTRTCGALAYVSKDQFGPDVLEQLGRPTAA